jgi:methionyl aminopeptidase
MSETLPFRINDADNHFVEPEDMYERISIRSAREVDLIRASSRVVAEVLESAYDWVRPGVTTGELDRKAEEVIRKRGGVPSFKGYLGYPATLCTSVNEQVVHGIPGDRVLEEGDILGVDVGCLKNGYHGDAARTYPVGKVSAEIEELLEAGAEALARGIEAARPGNYIGDIGYAVQSYAEPRGYSVVRDLVGHGIGERLHEAPQVPNYGRRGTLAPIRRGMVLAIEPMLNQGDWQVETLSDKWTVVTADRSLSVHFENTVAITEDGPVILTGFDRP